MRMAVLILIFGTIALAAPAPKEVKVPDYFPAKEGSEWSYSYTPSNRAKVQKTLKINVLVQKVTIEKESTKIVMSHGLDGGRKLSETFEIKGNDLMIIESSDIPAGLILFKKGAKVGEKWESNVTYATTRQGAAESVVGAPEEITVGGKKYNCIVTTHQAKINLGIPGGAKPANNELIFDIKIWFAPDVGIVKRERVMNLGPIQIDGNAYQLEEYTPKK